jgi:hypothetical protein
MKKTIACLYVPTFALALFLLAFLSCGGGGDFVAVNEVSLDKAKLALKVGESETLKATVQPENATNKALTWSSSDTHIASVSNEGFVTALLGGMATIIAAAKEGGKMASCELTVTVPVTGVQLNSEEITITLVTALQLNVHVLPENATNKKVSWGSSNEAVAIVAANGVVSAQSLGNATITATTEDGGKTAICRLTVIAPPRVPDVYMAGYTIGALLPVMSATIWKNGQVLYSIGGNSTGTGAVANSIYVSDRSDVYAAGYEYAAEYGNFLGPSVGKVWKNGAVEHIFAGTLGTNNGVEAASIYVSGDDVYVAGNEQDRTKVLAKVWKNGNVLYRLGSGANSAWTTSICVLGNDVYVGGYESNGSRNIAKIWKNGAELYSLDTGGPSVIYSIFVSDSGDIYAAGHGSPSSTRVAAIWKNGVKQSLDGSGSFEATSIYVSGDDVYVVGNVYVPGAVFYNGNFIRAWKNSRTLYDLGQYFYGSAASSIFVSGNDVYLAGGEYLQNVRRTARLWKNGSPQSISAKLNNSSVISIFIK